MTAAVASYTHHERFFGNDLTNYEFKTVASTRKSKSVNTSATPKKPAPSVKSDSPRNSPTTSRRKSSPKQIPSTPVQPTAQKLQSVPVIRYSKDLLLELRSKATADASFVKSLNGPALPKPKIDEEIATSSDDSSSSPDLRNSAQKSATKQREKESDEHRLAQRQKQLEYGKNTPGYLAFSAQVPREERNSTHPRTPEKNQKCSKRSWDGQVRKWRRQLHLYDPSGTDAPVDSGSSSDNDDVANVSQSADFCVASPMRSNAQQLGASIHAILASSGSPSRAEPGDAI